MAKRKSFIQKNIVDRLRSDPEYRGWWNNLLAFPEYKEVQLLAILDKEKTKNNKGISYWNPLTKAEFEKLYHDGKLNNEYVKIPDSMKTVNIILDMGLSCFFDPNPKREGNIIVNNVGMTISNDRSKNIQPHRNLSLPGYKTRDALEEMVYQYRKVVLGITVKDKAPSDAPLDPDSNRAKLNKAKAGYIKVMKRLLKDNLKQKYLELTDPRVKDLFDKNDLPKKKTLQNWASEARK